jgi:hypothetical protein
LLPLNSIVSVPTLGAAGEHVVAAAPEPVRLRQGAVDLVESERVVPGQPGHLDPRGVGDRRRAADDGDGTAVDKDRSRGVAGDDHRVVGSVAGHGERAVAERRRGGGARRSACRQGSPSELARDRLRTAIVVSGASGVGASR